MMYMSSSAVQQEETQWGSFELNRRKFYAIGISVTSITYNNVVPHVIHTQTLNFLTQWDFTNHHIFEIDNLFMPFSIGI